MKNLCASETAVKAGAAIALVMLASVPFLPSLSSSRLLDDDHYVFANPVLAGGLAALPRIWAGEHLMDYYPVTHTVFWLEWQFWGGSPLGFRAANIAWHVVGALAFWWAAAAWRFPWAWLLAAIWAVHPTNVDAVCWISQHKSTLSALAFALTLGGYAKFLVAGNGFWYRTSLAAHTLGMLAKTDVAMAPVVIVLLERWWWPRVVARPAEPASRAAILRQTAPFFVVSASLGAVALWFMKTRVVTSSIDMGTAVDRVLKAIWAYGFYWCTSIWPMRLAAVYGEPHLPLDALAAGSGILFIVALAWTRRRRSGGVVLLGMAVMAVLLLPVLYVAEQGFYRLSPVADRYLHVPLVVPAALVAAWAMTLAKLPHFSRPVLLGAGCLLVTLAGLTAVHGRDYRSEARLWRAAIDAQPHAWYARFGLAANLLWEDADYEGAVQAAALAVSANPHHPPSHYVAGFALLGLRRNGEAVSAFQKAVDLEPRYAMAWLALGEALLERSGAGDRDAAEAALMRASGLPGSADLAACQLARLDLADGDTASARARLAPILDKPGPSRFEARLTSAIVDLSAGNPIAAVNSLRAAADVMRTDRERDRLMAWAAGFSDENGPGKAPHGLVFSPEKAAAALADLASCHPDGRRLRHDAELARVLMTRRF